MRKRIREIIRKNSEKKENINKKNKKKNKIK